MADRVKVLILEDVPIDAELIVRELKRDGIEFDHVTADDEDSFRRALDEFKPDIVLADHSLPSFDGVSALKIVKEKNDIPFIFVSGKIGEEFAVEMLKAGATDYVLKSNLSKLPLAVRRALDEAAEERKIKEAQRALEESERKYRALFEKSGNPIFICATDGTVLDVNPAAAGFLKSFHEDITGKNLREWVREDDFRKLFTHGESGLVKFNVGLRGRLLDVSMTAVDMGGEKIIYLLGKDVTYQKHIEKELKSRKEEYRVIFENTGTLTLICGSDMVIELVNGAFESFSGYSRGEIQGQMKLTDFVDPSDRGRIEAYHKLRLLKPDAIPRNFEVRLQSRRGDEGNFFATMVTLPGEKCLISLMDITKKKMVEERLRKSLREKELLLREIHHRVKNNLQIISTLLMLQASTTSDPRLEELYRESQHRIDAISLIHEKLYESRDVSSINLRDYIKTLIGDLLESYGTGKRVNARVKVEDIRLNIETAIPCGLIINELVSNSLKYAFPDGEGEVTVEVKRRGDCYRMLISDDGVGLPEDLDPERVNTLGLRIVKNLVEQINGELEIKRPAEFIITFTEVEYHRRF
ncbi:histidine kinase dimerization/phosphoacceptor domain -containing protein [Methanothermobacter wolfeii]|uniref:Histidine kinase dimerization/phosphoacceptor domain -containing protein n=1 Tax=Methanothermobacter wolfeii TaxID=145261 RepID=A0ABU8TTQ7_METWO|nr:histidine kinase dimerization/phosphoacceptor domain -containing protein [Methanothermobacter sp. THM-1]NLM02901.1 PAS domain S-box protein [Methanothermobacter wolfeii]QHN06308.1 PAS domain S-box protein [Methanothermobacter sp. THM-1]SCM57008.1 putative sensor histidine kinase pdtaS [Methanothermobacter wolfeii]